MKKGLKIFGGVILAVILLMLILPFAFKGKIEQLVKTQANSMLDAKFDFSGVSISFFSAFPQASVSVDDISIVGNAPFQGDTLMYAKRIKAAVDITSLFSSEGYRITEVLLDKPLLQAIVADSLHANWDIMKADTTQLEQESAEEEASSDFRMKLEKFSIRNADIRYTDIPSAMKAALKDMNVEVSGDMSADQTDIKSTISIADILFEMAGVPYLKNASASADVNVAADLKNSKFTFTENTLSLNAIQTSLDGWVALPDSNTVSMDIRFNTSKIGFKDLLSLIPAIYSKEFAGLTASGNVAMNAWAKGDMKGEMLPAFEASLKVEDGMFKYASVPGSVSDIQIDAKASCAGGTADSVRAELSDMSLLLAGNRFSMSASACNMISDLQFAAKALGKVDLSKIADVYPLGDSLSLNGIITADASVAGSMSLIEKEQYENISAAGTIQAQNITLKQKSSDDVELSNARLTFTPKYVSLDAFSAKIGRNDLQMNGRLENFIAYALKDKTLKGSLNVASSYICADDFMSSDTAAVETAAADTAAMSVIAVPKNLDLALSVDMKKIDFGKMSFTDMLGKASVKDGIARLNGINFNAFEGRISANGAYDTSDENQPKADMSFSVTDASFKSTFTSVESLQKMAPIFENMTGNYNMQLAVKTDILPDFSPNMNTLTGNGVLKSSDVKISGVTALDNLADAVNKPSLKTIQPKDLNISFTIADGRITTKPFDVKLGSSTMNLSGSTGLDQTIDYDGTLSMSDGITVAGVTIKSLPFDITGTFKSPKIALDTKSAAKSVASDAVDKLKDKLGISSSSNDSTSTADKKEAVKEEAKDAAKKALKNLFGK